MTPRTLRSADGRELSPTLVGFIDTWHLPQRKAAGMMAVLFTKIDALGRAHPEWRDYDLISHVFACLHTIIENDRLTGGHTRSQVISDLEVFITLEGPEDQPAVHHEIAVAIVDLVLNAKDRHLRLQDRYLHFSETGAPVHATQSFRLARTAGEEDTVDPTLRAELEGINIFQNLFTFDPGDRATAERYRSERMLERGDYEEVLYSVERRATSIHSLQMTLTQLIQRMRANVMDIDYAHEVVPRLDEALKVIADQIEAEERFAESIADHTHLHAPDLHRLRRIEDQLQALVRSLTSLNRIATGVKAEYEAQQDRQVFTYRKITINPLTDLLKPALDHRPSDLAPALEPLLAVFAGVRTPAVPNLQQLIDKCTPTPARPKPTTPEDPFTLGPLRQDPDDLDPQLVQIIARQLASIEAPTSISELLDRLGNAATDAELTKERRAMAEWMLAVVIASAYGTTDEAEAEASSQARLFDSTRLAVARTGHGIEHPRVEGDDLIVVPRAPRTQEGVDR